MIQSLLLDGLKKAASDLHLSANHTPMLRIHGELCTAHPEILSSQAIEAALTPYLSALQQEKFHAGHDIDFSLTLSDLNQRFRVNLFRQYHGTSAVLRYIPAIVPTLDDLRAPAVFKDIIQAPHGLVLITGPTGCGKSTTLAAMINEINQKKSSHIVTIEDPIEFIHVSKKSLITQREIHTHAQRFEAALRSALREDPNIILVGELRDTDTIRLALTAAETGHLVFSTLHTSSAVNTIHRIIDVFPGNEKAMVRAMLAESLNSVIAQSWVENAGGGRRIAHEIMRCTPAIRNLIREDKIAQIYSAIQTGASQGMMTKEQSLLSKSDASHHAIFCSIGAQFKT